MYTAFSPGTKNLFLVLSAACCIVAFFLMDAMRKEQKRRKWVCGILLCILVAIAVVLREDLQHRRQGCSAHHTGIFAKGIENLDRVALGSIVWKPDLIIIFGADEGEGLNLVDALGDE